jgi:hypothetical protein
MTGYTDWYFRSNLADIGPGSAGRANSLSSCPDIIPKGSAPLEKSEYNDALVKTYSSDVGNNITANAPNYIYLRGRAQQVTTNVELKLFYTPSNIILLPALWNQESNQIPSVSGKPVIIDSVAPDTVMVSPEPFMWLNPAPPTPPADHYCLISHAVTTAHKDDIPGSFQSVVDFANWIKDHPYFGWRNVTLITDPAVVPSYTAQTSVNLSSIATPSSCWVAINAENIAIGWDVEFSFALLDANKNAIKLSRTKANQNTFIFGMPAVFGPGYKSSVYYSVYTNNVAPLDNFKISVDVAILTPATSPLFAHGISLLANAGASEDFLKGHLRVHPRESASLNNIYSMFIIGGDAIKYQPK